jgi:hypothetical protein
MGAIRAASLRVVNTTLVVSIANVCELDWGLWLEGISESVLGDAGDQSLGSWKAVELQVLLVLA